MVDPLEMVSMLVQTRASKLETEATSSPSTNRIPVARIRLLFVPLHEATDTATSGNYLHVSQLIDYLKGRRRDASDPESEWGASPWLHAQSRHALALALYRLYKDKDADDEILQAQGLVHCVAASGVDRTRLNARLASAKSMVETRLTGGELKFWSA